MKRRRTDTIEQRQPDIQQADKSKQAVSFSRKNLNISINKAESQIFLDMYSIKLGFKDTDLG